MALEPVELLIAVMSAKTRLICGRLPGGGSRPFGQGPRRTQLTTEHAHPSRRLGLFRALVTCPRPPWGFTSQPPSKSSAWLGAPQAPASRRGRCRALVSVLLVVRSDTAV